MRPIIRRLVALSGLLATALIAANLIGSPALEVWEELHEGARGRVQSVQGRLW